MSNRGFSRSGALACMCCTVVLGAIVVSCAQDDPEVNNSAASATDAASVTARLEAARRAPAERLDMLRLDQIYKGMMVLAVVNKDSWPTPGLVRRQAVEACSVCEVALQRAEAQRMYARCSRVLI